MKEKFSFVLHDILLGLADRLEREPEAMDKSLMEKKGSMTVGMQWRRRL